jgi:hypothetical protein
VSLAAEELSEAQQRFAAGVSDNLAVVQAQASVAQANQSICQQFVSAQCGETITGARDGRGAAGLLSNFWEESNRGSRATEQN